MPPPYQRHVFICTNRRPDDSPKGSCAAKGSEELPPLFKRACDAHNIKNVRINKAGCLDSCERGCSVVIYPEGVWYTFKSQSDIDEILETHLKNGGRVERLMLQPDQLPPKH